MAGMRRHRLPILALLVSAPLAGPVLAQAALAQTTPAPTGAIAPDLPSVSSLIAAPPPSLSVPGFTPNEAMPPSAIPAGPSAPIAGAPGPAPASGETPAGAPRIASGPAYESCLALVGQDPGAAARAAATWAAADPPGGDAALHCQALAEIALGHAEIGAEMLEQLAATSHAAALPRARIEDQAASIWLALNRPNHAYGAATMAIALSPKDVGFYLNRALAAAALGQYQLAIPDLNQVLAMVPPGAPQGTVSRVSALVLRGSAWRHLGKLDRAAADIAAALASAPNDPEALLERGILRQRQGDLTGAAADWHDAARLDPDGTTGDLARQNLALLEAGPAKP